MIIWNHFVARNKSTVEINKTKSIFNFYRQNQTFPLKKIVHFTDLTHIFEKKIQFLTEFQYTVNSTCAVRLARVQKDYVFVTLGNSQVNFHEFQSSFFTSLVRK